MTPGSNTYVVADRKAIVGDRPLASHPIHFALSIRDYRPLAFGLDCHVAEVGERHEHRAVSQLEAREQQRLLTVRQRRSSMPGENGIGK